MTQWRKKTSDEVYAADEDGKVLIWTGATGTAPGSDGNHRRDPLSYTPIHLVEKIGGKSGHYRADE